MNGHWEFLMEKWLIINSYSVYIVTLNAACLQNIAF